MNTNPSPRLPSWLWREPKVEPRLSPILERLAWFAAGFAAAAVIALALTS